jgi:hypothetical protein
MENIKPDWKLIHPNIFRVQRPVGTVPYLCESDHGSLAVKRFYVGMLWQDVCLL